MTNGNGTAQALTSSNTIAASIAALLTLSAQQAQSGEITEETAARWIAQLDAKPKTVQTYSRAIKPFLRWLQSQGITRPVKEDIQRYRDEIRHGHKATTAQAYLTAVKSFFSWTEDAGLYPDIAAKVKSVKVDSHSYKKDYLTAEQASDLLRSIDCRTTKGKRNYAMIALMITTGLRDVEIQRANLEDVRQAGGCNVLYIQGKGRDDKTEYVKLTGAVFRALLAYQNARRNEYGELLPDAPLFASMAHQCKGARLTTTAISGTVKEALRAIGLDSDRMTAHSLRHTAATLNLLAGATVEETQQLLRHANINTTMIYSHALERAKNNSEDRIAGSIAALS